MTGSGFDGTAVDDKIDLIVVSLILSCVSHLFSLLSSAGGARTSGRCCCDSTTKVYRVCVCVSSGRGGGRHLVMLFVAPRADVVAYDIVAGQSAARQATGKRGASGTGRGVAWRD